MRELFRDREFLAYFFARQNSRLAYSIEAVAISWQIYGLRHSAFDLGLVGLILFLPQLLLAIPAGIIADRFDRRIVCVLCALGDTAALLIFAALVLTHTRVMGFYLGAIAIVGISHSIGDPAERALLASIVSASKFVRANAMSTSVTQVITIAGPALGGALIAIAVPVALVVAAVFYAGGALALTFLTPRPVTERVVGLKAAVGGIRYIAQNPIVLAAISLDLFAVLFGGATALLPIYAVKILHIGAIGYGIMNSAPGIGAMIVALLIARRPISRGAGPLLLWCVAGFGVATIVFGVSRNLALSLLALAATGGFDIVSVVIRNALVQLNTPNQMRGRVSAIENIFIGASNQLGAFESGTVAGFIGPELSVALGGVATLVVVGLWIRLFPVLARYDRLGE
jgi:MFS family permease